VENLNSERDRERTEHLCRSKKEGDANGRVSWTAKMEREKKKNHTRRRRKGLTMKSDGS